MEDGEDELKEEKVGEGYDDEDYEEDEGDGSTP